MLVTLTEGSTAVLQNSDDSDGARVVRTANGQTTHYLGNYERNLGTIQKPQDVATKYYVATLGKMARLIAFRKGGTLSFVGTDHLGGTIRVADANFNPIDQMRYYAFGQSRDAGTNLNTDHLFTSQVQDQSIGLYWYNARAYDPALGRFCCPDTIVPDPKDPQALNRYAYARNNPLTLTDPTGHVYDSPSDGGYGSTTGGTTDPVTILVPTYDPGMPGDWTAPLGTDPGMGGDWSPPQQSLASQIAEHLAGGPDYTTASYSVVIPRTRGIESVTVQVVSDASNRVYIGLGLSTALGPPVTRTLTQSWILQAQRPTPQDTHDFIIGPSVSVFIGTGRFGAGATLGNVHGPPYSLNDFSIDAGYSPRQYSSTVSYTLDLDQAKRAVTQFADSNVLWPILPPTLIVPFG